MHDPNNPDSLGYRGLVYGTKTALETATLGLELASIYYTAGASAPAVFGKRVGSGVVRSMVNNISKTTQNTHSKGIINQSKIKKHTNIQNIKDKDALDDINKYLGKNQTNINPLTGKVDNNRIFGKQHNGTWRSVRIGEHEMKSDKNFHYHKEIVDLTTNKLREIDGGMTHILKTRKP